MPPDLLSFLEKLSQDSSTYKLEWSGLNIDTKYSQLKSILDLPHNKLLSLAVLLQHVDLNLFTQRELQEVAKLNIEAIAHQESIEPSKTLSKYKPLFDTNSSYLFSIINPNSLSANNFYQDNSSYLNFNSEILTELIVNLYTGGY